MTKLLISLPDALASQFRATVPMKKRSQMIVDLLEKALKKKEKTLYDIAIAVEQDKKLHQDMAPWNETIGDGLDDETW